MATADQITADPIATSYPRLEVERAFRAYRSLVEGSQGDETRDYSGYSSIFVDDLVYIEHVMGDPAGRPGSPLLATSRQGIDAWMAMMMTRDLPPMTFPLEWFAIDGNRVIFKALNRLAPPADGSGPYEVASMSQMIYGGGGRFALKEDFYNGKLWDQVLTAWTRANGVHTDRRADVGPGRIWAG